MGGEQRSIPLRELCDQARGITYGIVQPGSHVDDGVPILRADNIENGRVVAANLLRVARGVEASYARSRLRGGEILVTLVGAYFGKVAIAGAEHVGMNTARAVGVIPVPKDALYISYALRSPSCQDHFRTRSTTTAQPTLNLGDLSETPVPWPDEHTRHAIASALGALDDKIEVNRKMSATLEAMARALFKSWFVDFDPVRAKVDGRAPSGMDAETAKLFPSELVESERGAIPKGWDPSTLERYADLNSETWVRVRYPASIQYVDLSAAKWGVIESLSFFNREEAPSRAQRVLRRGDTIVGTVRPGNGSFALVDRAGLTGSTGFAVLRPRRPEARTFVYFAATSSENIDRLAHLADGGAYPAVRPELVVQTKVAGAPDNVVTRFETAVASIMDRIASSRAESAALGRVRDELLPRLLSGAIEVGALVDPRGGP